MVGKRNPTYIRFLDKFTPGEDTACWEWIGNKNGAGYGLLWSPEDDRKVLAHRYSFEFFNKRKISHGNHILHHCDNPGCVNPNHLMEGTHAQNMVDAAWKGRSGNLKLADASVISLLRDYIAGMSHADIATKYRISIRSVPDFTGGKSRAWLHGHHGCPTLEDLENAKNRKPGAVLTAEIVREIRLKLANGAQGKDLAAEYGMHKATISDIKLRKIWADI